MEENSLIFHFEGDLLNSAMMHTHNAATTEPEQTFQGLQIDHSHGVQFYPRRGFEGKRGSVNHTFYVVERGYCPGIYTHWCALSSVLCIKIDFNVGKMLLVK
jgi:hypothetical protein